MPSNKKNVPLATFAFETIEGSHSEGPGNRNGSFDMPIKIFCLGDLANSLPLYHNLIDLGTLGEGDSRYFDIGELR